MMDSDVYDRLKRPGPRHRCINCGHRFAILIFVYLMTGATDTPCPAGQHDWSAT